MQINTPTRTSVHPMLCLITSPSFRTYPVVATPTLAVCGAIGLPTSAPTEFNDGASNGGKPSRLPTIAWNAPNMALVDVLLPESATPIQPRIGATTINHTPSFERHRPATR